MQSSRMSGILMPVASLAAKDIGNFGQVAYQFLDQLASAGQKIWQMLPIGPTITHDSPFYSPSAFAISPNYICLENLVDCSLVMQSELDEYYHTFDYEDANRVNYGLVWEQKRPLLRKAFGRFLDQGGMEKPDFIKFVEEQKFWLEDYTQFSGIKELYLGHRDKETWFLWPQEFKNKTRFTTLFKEFLRIAAKNKEVPIGHWRLTGVDSYWNTTTLLTFLQIQHYAHYHAFLQWIVLEQWKKIRTYAKDKGILLIGDCPIYVAPDSADVWANQSVFKLDEHGNQICYAGVPPDYFSPKFGQFWGNPIYKWYLREDSKELNREAFEWWYKRLFQQFSLFDEVRIDHFRGFAGYWEIPADKCEDRDNDVVVKTAKFGSWKQGPAIALFEYIAQKLGKKVTELPIIAEDLGLITQDVAKLREGLQAPGMAIFQFAPWNNLHYEDWPGHYTAIKDVAQVQNLPFHTKETWNRLYYWGDNKFEPFIQHEFLPENAKTSGKLVCYPGTHDNETLTGWFLSIDRNPVEKAIFERYLNYHLGSNTSDSIAWKVILVLLSHPQVRYTIFQMQDILDLPNVDVTRNVKFRMNIPNKEGQWQWKMAKDQFTPELVQRLRTATQKAGR